MQSITAPVGLRWLIVILVILVGLLSLIVPEVAAIDHLDTLLIVALAIAVAPW